MPENEIPEEVMQKMRASMSKMADDFYNMAIDHCIVIAGQFLSQVPGLSEPLIKKYESLKKNKQ